MRSVSYVRLIRCATRHHHAGQNEATYCSRWLVLGSGTRAGIAQGQDDADGLHATSRVPPIVTSVTGQSKQSHGAMLPTDQEVLVARVAQTAVTFSLINSTSTHHHTKAGVCASNRPFGLVILAVLRSACVHRCPTPSCQSTFPSRLRCHSHGSRSSILAKAHPPAAYGNRASHTRFPVAHARVPCLLARTCFR